MQVAPSREFPIHSVRQSTASGPLSGEGARLHTSGEGGFQELLRGLSARLDQGEASFRQALGPRAATADAAGLLRLQASIYRYTESLELCTRLVDRTTQAIRTTLQQSG